MRTTLLRYKTDSTFRNIGPSVRQFHPRLLRFSAVLRRFPVFLFCLAVAVFLQWRNGAYSSDFAGHADESAHYVTGLMVRDYLAAFPWQPPMTFAHKFYDHYPKVALGHWPPLFYLTQALWTLPFSAGRTSILLLMAVIAAIIATVLFEIWRPHFRMAGALLLAVTFLATPIVQAHSGMVMAELLVTLFALVAALAYARYLQTERWHDAALFGLVAAAAVLTKANGLALALLPIIAVLVARRVHLVGRFSFWLPALVVLALCAPWYVWTIDLAREGWSASYSPAWLLREPAVANTRFLIGLTGIGFSLLAAVGLFAQVVKPWPRLEVTEYWAAMAALVASLWLFHSFVLPVREPRHLIPAVPALLAFSAAGLLYLVQLVAAGPIRRRWITVACTAAAGMVFVAEALPVRGKQRLGADVVAETIFAHPQLAGATTLLVSSESDGEGVFIAEIAMREERPGHRVLRASKVLSQANWDGSGYQLSYTTPEQVRRYLETERVAAVVLDMGTPLINNIPHHHLLLDVVRTNPERWRLMAFGRGRESRFRVFEAVGIQNLTVR